MRKFIFYDKSNSRAQTYKVVLNSLKEARAKTFERYVLENEQDAHKWVALNSEEPSTITAGQVGGV